MLEKIINNFFILPVTKLQFANASDWENCLVLEKNSIKNTFDEWADSLSANFIGVEAFFDIPEKNMLGAFIGFRASASKENIAECSRLAASFIASDTDYLLENFVKAEQCLLVTKDLSAGEPDFIELGIVNNWNSVGAMRFWNRGDGDIYECFLSELDRSPRFKNRLPAYAAIEFAYSSPIPHWLGLPVYSVIDNIFYLSIKKSGEVLSDFSAHQVN